MRRVSNLSPTTTLLIYILNNIWEYSLVWHSYQNVPRNCVQYCFHIFVKEQTFMLYIYIYTFRSLSRQQNIRFRGTPLRLSSKCHRMSRNPILSVCYCLIYLYSISRVIRLLLFFNRLWSCTNNQKIVNQSNDRLIVKSISNWFVH